MIQITAKNLARPKSAWIYSHSINLIKSRINCDAGFAKSIMDKYSLGDSEFPPASFVFFETGEEGAQEVQKGIVNLLLQILHYEDYQIFGPFQKMIYGYLKQNAEFWLEQLKYISGKDYRTFVQLYEKIIRITDAGPEYSEKKKRQGIINELEKENKAAEKKPVHHIETDKKGVDPAGSPLRYENGKKQEMLLTKEERGSYSWKINEERIQKKNLIQKELLSIARSLQISEQAYAPQGEAVRRFLEALPLKDQEDMAALLGFKREELMEMSSYVRQTEWADVEKTIRDRLLEIRRYITSQESILPDSGEQSAVPSEPQVGLEQEELEAPGLKKWKNILQNWIMEINDSQWKIAASFLQDSGGRFLQTLTSVFKKEDRLQAAEVLNLAETIDDIYPLLTIIYREDQLRKENNIWFSSLQALIERRELEEREKAARETETLEVRKNRILRQAESFEDQEWQYMEENYFHTGKTIEKEDYISQIRQLPEIFREEVLKAFFQNQNISETELDHITEEQWRRIGKTSVWALDKAVFLSQAVRWGAEEVNQAESLLRREYRDYYRQETVQNSREEFFFESRQVNRREDSQREEKKETPADFLGGSPAKEKEAPGLERWKYLLKEWISYMDQEEWEMLSEEAKAEKQLSQKAEAAFQEADRYQVSVFLSAADSMEDIYPILEMIYRKEELKEAGKGWLPGLETLVKRQEFLTKIVESGKEKTLTERREMVARIAELMESREWQYIETNYLHREEEKTGHEQTGSSFKADFETNIQWWNNKETFLTYALRFNEKELKQAEKLLRREYRDYYGMAEGMEEKSLGQSLEKNSQTLFRFRLLPLKGERREDKRWFGWEERRTLEKESQEIWNIDKSVGFRQEPADKSTDGEKKKEAPGLEQWKYLLKEWVGYMDQKDWDVFIEEVQKERTILSSRAEKAFQDGDRYQLSNFLWSAESMEEIYPILEIIYRNDGLRDVSATWLPGLKSMVEKQELLKETEKLLENGRLEERRQELLRLAELFDSREFSYREAFVSKDSMEREKERDVRQMASLPEKVGEEVMLPAVQNIFRLGSSETQMMKETVSLDGMEKDLLLKNISLGGEGELKRAFILMKQADALYYGYDKKADSLYIQDINEYPQIDIIYQNRSRFSKTEDQMKENAGEYRSDRFLEKFFETHPIDRQAGSNAMKLLKLVEQEKRERDRLQVFQERELSSKTSHSQRILERWEDGFQEYRENPLLLERQGETRMVLLTRKKDLSTFLEKTVYGGGTVYREGTGEYSAGREEGESLPLYAPASMVVTRIQERAGRQQQMTPSLDIEKVVRQVKEETIKDIRFIDRGGQEGSQSGESFRQMEELLRKISDQQKELEGIKQTQAGMIQMVDTGKIADAVMKQFKAQLKIEKLRRGL